jgi:hypothetical protein
MSTINYMSIEEFVDGGYLQEVNRRFMHPLGLALEVSVEGEQYALSGVWDYRDDPEGMCFARGTVDRDKADRIELELAQKIQSRKELLGYDIQPVDED